MQHEVTGSERLGIYFSTIAFQWIASAIVAWRCLVGGLGRVGLGVESLHPVREAIAAVIVSILLVANQIIGVRRLAHQPQQQRGVIGRLAERLLPRTAREKQLGLFLVLTVAICEEFLYRGFVEGWFQTLTSSAAAGAVISAGFFALAHLYQSRRGVLTTFFVGLVFSGVRIWTGSLLPSVLIHFAVDLSAGIASSRLLTPLESKAI